jgi:trigger factor
VIKSKNVERKENSRVKLTVTVPQNEVKDSYQNLLKEYSKSVQIKGFRKGKVPANVLERKFGDGIKAEATQNIMESSLKEAFDDIEEKPLPYSMPELAEELDMDLEKDFTFSVSYDVYPDIKLGDYKQIEIEVPEVSITKEDEERELKALQEQNAMVVEKKEGTVEKDNIVTVNMWEVDESGAEVPDTKREDFVFTVGTGYNLYKIDDEIIGMKQGEEKTIEKEFPEDYEHQELSGTKRKIACEVTAIKERKLPEIDDELAQDISDEYETLADLKKDIRKRLEDSADARLRELKVNKFLEQLAEISEYELPESMLKAELNAYWQNFVSRFQTDEEQISKMLQSQGNSREKLEEEWKPNAQTSLTHRLLTHELLEQEKIEISDEEREARLAEQAESSSMNVEDVKTYYQNNNMMEYLDNDLKQRKLFDALLENIKTKKGKKIKFLDLLQGNQ